MINETVSTEIHIFQQTMIRMSKRMRKTKCKQTPFIALTPHSPAGGETPSAIEHFQLKRTNYA